MKGASDVAVQEFKPEFSPAILLPTRNRPASLSSVLQYLATFYPGARVVVADGSEDSLKHQNAAFINTLSDQLEISHRSYPFEMSMLDRMSALYESLPDDYYIMGADDDYPILENITKAKSFLENNRDYIACGGVNIMVRLLNDEHFKCSVFKAISIEHRYLQKRFTDYGSNFFATYYCVTTRQQMLSRLECSRRMFVAGFGDFMLGLHDLSNGKLKILDSETYIRTSSPVHSYLRVTDRLNFLRESKKVIAIFDQITTDLLSKMHDPTLKRAQQIAQQLIVQHIHLLTRPSGTDVSPHRSLYMDDTHASKILNRYADDIRMQYIKHKLIETRTSEDNRSEHRIRSSME